MVNIAVIYRCTSEGAVQARAVFQLPKLAWAQGHRPASAGTARGQVHNSTTDREEITFPMTGSTTFNTSQYRRISYPIIFHSPAGLATSTSAPVHWAHTADPKENVFWPNAACRLARPRWVFWVNSHLASAKKALLLVLKREKAEKLPNWVFISLLFLPISQTASVSDLSAGSCTIW